MYIKPTKYETTIIQDITDGYIVPTRYGGHGRRL